MVDVAVASVARSGLASVHGSVVIVELPSCLGIVGLAIGEVVAHVFAPAVALLELPERNRFMKGLFGWVGFRSVSYPIEMVSRPSGNSKFGFRGLARLALTALTSFTDWPLRIWTGIGFFIAFISFLYGTWIFAKTLIWGVETPGFATITVAVFFLGGIQLVSIGVIGEYLARVFTEVKGRPGYIVADDTE